MTHPSQKPAAGAAAVSSSLAFFAHETGLIRGSRAALKMNQTSGFDCPGCAWPDPLHRSKFEFCENGAKALADMATTKQCGPAFFAQYSLEALREQPDTWLNAQGRLTHPMVWRKGWSHYQAIDWSDALDLVAETLKRTPPNEALFYTSGRTSNEAAFLYQLLARQYGTNNLPDCSNMCHESSGTGLGEALGVGKGSVSLADFDQCDAILVMGQNPGTNHPRMLTTLQQAARRGCQIICVNPLKEAALLKFAHPQEVSGLLGIGTPIATHYVQVRIGGDIAFLKGVFKVLLELETHDPGSVFDHAFIREKTAGFEDFLAPLHHITWEQIEAQSGISHLHITQVAQVLARSKRVIACWAMGLTQHVHAVHNVQEVVNLLLLLGQIGKEGAGVCPVRGHSNVQGDRTMGICEKPNPAFLQRLEAHFGFEAPKAHGHDTVAAISAMLNHQAKVFIGMGGNFLSAAPDTVALKQAMLNLKLHVQISTKLNRSHLHAGDAALILPALSRSDCDQTVHGLQFVTVEDSMSAVHASRGHLTPHPQQRSEVWLCAELGARLFGDAPVRWRWMAEDHDRIRNSIEAVVPGFEDFNARIREPFGFVLPNAVREQRFDTHNQKANFTPVPLPDLRLDAGALWMMTIRSHDQFNTTIYTQNDRYRGVFGDRNILLMHPDDMLERGLKEGDPIRIWSRFAGKERSLSGFKALAYDLPKGCTASYFPETNPLVPLELFAHKSRTPASKSIPIWVERN